MWPAPVERPTNANHRRTLVALPPTLPVPVLQQIFQRNAVADCGIECLPSMDLCEFHVQRNAVVDCWIAWDAAHCPI